MFQQPLRRLISSLRQFTNTISIRRRITSTICSSRPVPLILARNVISGPSASNEDMFPRTGRVRVLIIHHNKRPHRTRGTFRRIITVRATLFDIRMRGPTFTFKRIHPVIRSLPTHRQHNSSNQSIRHLFHLHLAHQDTRVARHHCNKIIGPCGLKQDLMNIHNLCLQYHRSVQRTILIRLHPQIAIDSFFIFRDTSNWEAIKLQALPSPCT